MPELKKYSKSEIALHTSKKDCWVLIGGKVYDVTSFLEEHPGGEEPLLHSSAAGDATQAFEDVGHSTSAVSMMQNYLIGTVEGYIPPRSEPSKAAAAVSAPKKTQQKPKPPPSSSVFEFLVPISIIILALAAYYYFKYYDKEVKA